MLKKFFLNILSSFVGAWLAIVLILIGIGILIISIVGSIASKESKGLSKKSVLKISLMGTIVENEVSPQLDMGALLTGKIEQPQTLQGLLASLEKAKINNNINAVYIECNGADAAPATLNALREGIKDFKSSGKRVFAYGDNFSMGDFYVATAADEVYLNPMGSLNLQGINGTSLYFKDLLDKIGVDVQTVRVGSFKSAIEPYTSNEMSEAAHTQLDSLYTEMWTYIVDNISKDTKTSTETIDSLVNNFIYLDKAEISKKYHLVSDTKYYRQILEIIANYVGTEMEDINFVSPQLLVDNTYYNTGASNQIAVLYAVGEIGEFENAGINCHKLVPLIVQLANDENVKGLVLRVNSPGGSVFGSDQIGEALDYFKSKGKPLAVSMGDYAASGGYWISAGGDIIFADPLTITGSIGIFGMVPNIGQLADKLGIHPQTVGTNPQVMFPSIFYPMTSQQEAHLQASIDRGYNQFINRVASGRGKSVEYIKSIAEGRVWNAIKAKELGLVDKLGGLNDAVNWISNKTEIDNYSVVYYPTPEVSWLNMIMTPVAESTEVKEVVDKMSTPDFDQRLMLFTSWFLSLEPMQARCPYYKLSF